MMLDKNSCLTCIKYRLCKICRISKIYCSNSLNYIDWLYFKINKLLLFLIIKNKMYYFNMIIDDIHFLRIF